MSNFDEKNGFDRRKFLKIGGVSTLAITLGATGIPGELFGQATPTASAKANYDKNLKFNAGWEIQNCTIQRHAGR